MIRSMTGFGRGVAADEHGRAQVDVRTVNHRHLDLQVRVPRNLAPLEMELRDWVKERFWRGRVEVSVLYERTRRDADQLQADPGLAAVYYARLEEIAARLKLEQKPSLDTISRLPGVFELREDVDDFEIARPALRDAFARATDNALQMKTREGASLRRDLADGLARMRVLRDQLAATAPQAQGEIMNRLRERAVQLAAEVKLDATRLHQETALWLTRLDVNEELVRLVSHFDQFATLLDAGESVGRRLDFLAQEMHREITTLGNKLQGLPFSGAALDLKVEIEKIREQVQNVE
jgi:uncharacterized protein (TIGR00255 family)